MFMLFRSIAVLCAFVFSLTAFAAEDRLATGTLGLVRPNMSAANVECFKVITRAIPSFYRKSAAAQAFNTRDLLVYGIATSNDMMCTDPEWMANVTITVTDPRTRESWYGIFHVHVTPDGTFKSGSSYYQPEWVSFTRPIEWQTRWCDYITVYPEDYKKQCGFIPRKK